MPIAIKIYYDRIRRAPYRNPRMRRRICHVAIAVKQRVVELYIVVKLDIYLHGTIVPRTCALGYVCQLLGSRYYIRIRTSSRTTRRSHRSSIP